ncbi:hypothetical protein [Novosphingobium flavum]|uniref:hypothetical protein n=1 Tax=Novosphingobium flavum TaxID=1778672 RepID=UPI001FEAACBA|nr:hypothetical protein [Novosphingobium flavum]
MTLSAPALGAEQAQSAAPTKAARSAKARKGGTTLAPQAAPAPVPPPTEYSGEAARVAGWVAATGDNSGLPYAIVDKKSARVFLFSASGERLADAPVLIGMMTGDDATAGVGDKPLAEIGPAEKTTPAGRFLAKFGIAAGNTRVLWVDFATSVALHPIPPANKEHRAARMLSPTIDDNRITYGCINVPKAFYAAIGPLFKKNGGYVYVLPDEKSLEQVFPLIAMYTARAPALAQTVTPGEAIAAATKAASPAAPPTAR